MDPAKAQTLATDLMKEHKVAKSAGGRFIFRWSRAVRQFGVCSYPRYDWQTGTIRLSLPLVKLNDEPRVRNTILHEIAHALAPRGTHHGAEWRRIARNIGCDAERCYDAETVAAPPARWQGVCPICGQRIERHKRRFSTACGRCFRTHGARALFNWSRV